jgi:hypothetical protein
MRGSGHPKISSLFFFFKWVERVEIRMQLRRPEQRQVNQHIGNDKTLDQKSLGTEYQKACTHTQKKKINK